MIVKTDFVTNSSSTAYIVSIPNNYSPSRSEVLKAYNDVLLNTGDEPLENSEMEDKLFHEVDAMVEELKMANEGISPYEGCGDVTWGAWNTCLEICGNHDFILEYLDINSENGYIIKGIPEERIWKVLAGSIDLTDMLQDFIIEEKSK